MSAVPIEAPRRPLLRYHGGKWRLAPWIIGLMPEHQVYVEPFGGAASVLLRKPRSYAEVYNDLDGEVVHLFQVLRDPGAAGELCRAVALTPYSRDEFRLAYEPVTDPIERARRLTVRFWFAFGTTGRRAHQTGFRATPWRNGGGNGAQEWGRMPMALMAISERLQGVLIENRPALEVVAQQDRAETLFYCDPPYPLSTRTSARWKSRHELAYAFNLSDEDHTALAERLQAIRGMALVSGYRCDLYEALYAGWERVERAAMADGAARRTEVLWLSPAASEARANHQLCIDAGEPRRKRCR